MFFLDTQLLGNLEDLEWTCDGDVEDRQASLETEDSRILNGPILTLDLKKMVKLLQVGNGRVTTTPRC